MKAVLNKWTYIEEKVLIGSLIFDVYPKNWTHIN